MLANAKRRTVIQYFIAQETNTTNLDEHVDSVHEGIDTITTPEQARIELVHIHLPKLVDYQYPEAESKHWVAHHGYTIATTFDMEALNSSITLDDHFH